MRVKLRGYRVEPEAVEAAIYSLPMLENQADRERLRPAGRNRPRIVLLSAQGQKSPVFLVHPLSGSVEMYYETVERMGLDRPCYGIRAPTITPSDSELTIEGIAAAYLQSVQALLPSNGKAVFAGYSLGGAIAYEMARQHAESSGTAPPVLIIDCESGVPRSRFQVAAEVVLTLPGWLRHVAPKRDPKALLMRGVHRLRRMLGLIDKVSHHSKSVTLAGRNAMRERARRLMMDALDRYVGRPYAGAVVLLRATHPGLFSMRDPSLGWSGLAPDLRVDTVPGSHEDCLWCENLAPSAEILRRHFESFD